MTTSTASTTVLTSTEPKAGATVPSNRILVNFRVTRGGDKEATHFFAGMERHLILKGDRSFFTEAEQEHAAKVLARLVAISA